MLKGMKTIREMTFHNVLVQVCHGDLTKEKVDAIVNAANSRLAHGGGVAAAISRAGGPNVQTESNAYVAKHGPIPIGGAGHTGPGRLTSKYLIHAVGPIYKSGNDGEERLLKSAITSSFYLAEKLGCRSIAFPAISSGIFGYPKELCAKHFFEVIHAYAKEERGGHVENIRLTNFDEPTVSVFASAFDACKARL